MENELISWLENMYENLTPIPSSSSSSYIFHGVGPLVDLFRSHVPRILFKVLLPVGE